MTVTRGSLNIEFVVKSSENKTFEAIADVSGGDAETHPDDDYSGFFDTARS